MSELAKIEERLFNTLEGKWFLQDNKILVILPDISLSPIVVAEVPKDTVADESILDFLVNSKSDIIYLINEVKRLKSLIESTATDYVI